MLLAERAKAVRHVCLALTFASQATRITVSRCVFVPFGNCQIEPSSAHHQISGDSEHERY